LNSLLNQISVLIHWQAGEKDSSSNRSSNRKQSFALYAGVETIDRLRYFGQYARGYQPMVMIGVFLNSGIHVITKPIGAQIIHKFIEFCALPVLLDNYSCDSNMRLNCPFRQRTLRQSAFQRREQVDYGPPIGKVYIHSPEDLILYQLMYFGLSQ
jgi:hypothetical protein